MSEINVILKGGMQGCCSVYSASELRRLTKDWFPPQYNVQFNILDIQEDYWETDEIAEFAYRHLGDIAFPMVCIGKILVALGDFPDRDVLLEYVKNGKPVTKDVILQLEKQFVTNHKK